MCVCILFEIKRIISVHKGHDFFQKWWLLKEPLLLGVNWLHRILPGYLATNRLELVITSALPPHKFVEIPRQHFSANSFHRLQFRFDPIPTGLYSLRVDTSYWVRKEQRVVDSSVIQAGNTANMPYMLLDYWQLGYCIASLDNLDEAGGGGC